MKEFKLNDFLIHTILNIWLFTENEPTEVVAEFLHCEPNKKKTLDSYLTFEMTEACKKVPWYIDCRNLHLNKC